MNEWEDAAQIHIPLSSKRLRGAILRFFEVRSHEAFLKNRERYPLPNPTQHHSGIGRRRKLIDGKAPFLNKNIYKRASSLGWGAHKGSPGATPQATPLETLPLKQHNKKMVLKWNAFHPKILETLIYGNFENIQSQNTIIFKYIHINIHFHDGTLDEQLLAGSL